MINHPAIFSVDRFCCRAHGTLSLLRKPCGDPICFGVEDPYQDVKIYGKTCIPDGTYKVIRRTHGGFHNRYKERFAPWHTNMWEIANVPGFSDILIHPGNTPDDTKGCYLPGDWGTVTGIPKVTHSSVAYTRVWSVIDQYELDGFQIYFRFTKTDVRSTEAFRDGTIPNTDQ